MQRIMLLQRYQQYPQGIGHGRLSFLELLNTSTGQYWYFAETRPHENIAIKLLFVSPIIRDIRLQRF